MKTCLNLLSMFWNNFWDSIKNVISLIYCLIFSTLAHIHLSAKPPEVNFGFLALKPEKLYFKRPKFVRSFYKNT